MVLVDPAGVAEQVLEKRGPSYCAELARELLAPLRAVRPPATGKLTPTYRVTWRGGQWKASTATKSRSFARAADARRAALRYHSEGHDVRVSTCSRTAWVDLDLDAFLDGEGVEL